MSAESPYHAALIAAVIDLSEASQWSAAVREWAITDWEEDPRQRQSCICGHPDLRYLFTISNMLNGNTLFPIGSVCINRFERDDLDEEVSTRVQMFHLLQAMEDGEFITLDSGHFSRKLLRFLFEEGAFQPNPFNGFDPEVDYQFMLDMFNKHGEPTAAQRGKIRAVIAGSIRPHLEGILRGRS